MNKIEKISIKLIKPDPKQPRQEFDIPAMKRLIQSVKELGILNPLSLEKVNGTYLIVDGERRFRAAKKLGLTAVPAFVSDKMSEQERLIRRFHLQEQHAGWSALDKATAIYNIQQMLGISAQETAKMLGLSVTTVFGYIAAMTLSKRTLTIAENKKIPLDYLREVAWISKLSDLRKIKSELEDSLIKKIESGLVERARELRFYGQALRQTENKKLRNKILDNILKNPKFSPKDALDMAHLSSVQQIKSITGGARWLSSRIKRATEDNYGKYLSPSDCHDLEKLLARVRKFIDSAGYVLPKEK